MRESEGIELLVWKDGVVSVADLNKPNRGEVGWAHLVAPSEVEIQTVMREIFHCHPLAVEDTIHFGQRPKLDQYTVDSHAHAYITIFSVEADMTLSEFCVVVGENYLITITQKPIAWLDQLFERTKQFPEYMDQTGTILHRVLDQCVDTYFHVIDDLETKLDTLERRVFNHPEAKSAQFIFRLKRRVHKLRRTSVDIKAIMGLLAHDPFPYIEEKHIVYFVDIYDHISRVVDGLDAARDNLSGLLDLQTAQRANRMNEIMKTLTIFSTIFLPLSFIVGLYGMNFKNIPELSWSFGYLYAWGLMVAVIVGLVVYFRRKGWW